MMKSMTAFGTYRTTCEGKEIVVEIRSVNNRFLDASVRIPRKYNVQEDRVRAYLKDAGISRGKLDLSVTVTDLAEDEPTVFLDDAYVQSYLAALYQLRDRYGLRDDISVMTVAADPHVMTSKEPDSAENDISVDGFEILRPAIDGAVSDFLAARSREGARLEADLRAKLSAVEEMVETIKAQGDTLVNAYRARLEERLARVLSEHHVDADPARILTECAIFADRVAIDEELVRLSSHFRTFDEIAASNEPAGRKLDFLLQEINREVNTIGSKCSDAAIAKIVVNIKNELEKIREQVQNIE